MFLSHLNRLDKRFFKNLMLGFFLFLNLLSIFTISVFAQSECGEVKEINWWDIANPGEFLPIVPASCSVDGDRVRALPISLIPEMFIRIYGFFVAVGFYLINLMIVASGLFYMYGGVDPGQIQAAKKLLTNSGIGLAMLVLFYQVVFLILGFLKLDLAQTDLNSFL